jgi:hypothetical protein
MHARQKYRRASQKTSVLPVDEQTSPFAGFSQLTLCEPERLRFKLSQNTVLRELGQED